MADKTMRRSTRRDVDTATRSDAHRVTGRRKWKGESVLSIKIDFAAASDVVALPPASADTGLMTRQPSVEFLIRRSQVRILPGTSIKSTTYANRRNPCRSYVAADNYKQFQWLPLAPGGSTQHERDMECSKESPRRAGAFKVSLSRGPMIL